MSKIIIKREDFQKIDNSWVAIYDNEMKATAIGEVLMDNEEKCVSPSGAVGSFEDDKIIISINYQTMEPFNGMVILV